MTSITTFCNRCFRTLQFKHESETLYPRFLRFIHEAHRDGVMGDTRYAVALSKAEKLHRFLVISNLTSVSAAEFTTSHVQLAELYNLDDV